MKCLITADGGRQRGGAADYTGPVPTNQRVHTAAHNMERPMQYEYSNEPEDNDEDDEDEDSDAERRNYVNELILQRSRNRHPAFTDDNNDDDDDARKTTLSTVRPSSMYASMPPPTTGGRGIMFPSCPSGCPSTPIPHDAISLYLVEGFQ